jgi:hypothetical protein
MSVMARKGIYLAGDDLSICRNIPDFSLYTSENIQAFTENSQFITENI